MLRASLLVSIHAPTWGATCLKKIQSPASCGFQSTRPRGARLIVYTATLAEALFQSTRPRGARRAQLLVVLNAVEVSIHAPTWGATSVLNKTHDVIKMFQSTRPRGARQIHSTKIIQEYIVSIHAPTWGATLCACHRKTCTEVSIHAPTWGATPYWAISLKSSLKISIFAKT